MSYLEFNLSCPVHDSFRVQQVLGMFDMPGRDALTERFSVELPGEDEAWDIGVIVGPSGSGKTSVARKAYGCNVYDKAEWPAGRAVIDCFGKMPIRDLTRLLTLVGFSSPPAWIKPFAVLSNGEKFRCELARALMSDGDGNRAADKEPLCAETEAAGDSFSEVAKPLARTAPPVVFDEFTSVVDRTVARIASAALSRAVRRGKINRRFVAVTCHYDVLPWLEPDWVLDMATRTLSRRRLRRPRIRLDIRRCDRSLWPLFQRHHYLSGTLHQGAQCYLGTIDHRPAVFTAVLFFPHPLRPGWREHRTVCLPDYQGIGIGSAMSAYIASVYVATKRPYFSTSSHPAIVHHRANSPLWKMNRRPGLVSRISQSGIGKTGMAAALSSTRLTAGFEYIGPPNRAAARKFRLPTK